jgi:hypothetical protein
VRAVAHFKEFIVSRFVPVIFAAVSAIALCAFDSGPDSALLQERADATQALNRGFDRNESQGDLLDAESAGARGDWVVSAALAEQSYKERPDIINEFDLATAYQHTDRNALAVPLYIDLLDRGRHTRTVPVENFNRSMPPPMLPTLADEAALRLRNMGVTTGLGNTHGEFPALASVN